MAQQLEWNEAAALEATEQGSTFDLLGVVWRRKWVALSVLALCVALGYLYFLNATPMFRSEAQLLLIKKEAKLSGDTASSKGSPYGGYEDALSTQMILMTSSRVVRQAVEEHKELHSLPSFQGIEASGPEEFRAEVTKAIIEHLRTTRAGDRNHPDPNVANLTFESPFPEDCAVVLDAVIDSYEKCLAKYYKVFSNEILALITKAKDELRLDLEDLDDALKESREQAPWRVALQGQEAMGDHDLQKIELVKAISQAQIDMSNLEALAEAIEQALKTGVNKASMQLLMTNVQLDKMRPRDAVLDKLLDTMFDELQAVQAYGEDHPQVRLARQKLSLLREKILNVPIPDLADSESVLKIYLESLKREVSLAADKIKRLDKLSKVEGNLAKQESNRTDEEALKADRDDTRKLFDTVVRQLAEMDITKDYGGITMQKLKDPALGELVKPKLAIVLAVAGVFGLFAGVGLCYVIELADRSFRSPEDVCRQLGVPIVGHIPVIPIHRRSHAKKKGEAAESPLHPVICTYHQPRGRQSEAYRAVRTSLYFGTQGETHKVIQITSPNPGDGKTTLAANLAVSIADSGKRVLLVDADFRRPKIHKYFGLDNAAGVSSVVAGETEIVDAILPTTVENLSAMPCGPRPRNPADLLTSPRFKEMIDLVRDKYDFVIVDTPPLLAVTDPSVVAPRVDGVLMVLRLTKHARDAAMRANEVLNALGVHTLGVVVNGIGKGTGYGYGSYRYGGYRYDKYRKGYGYGYSYGSGYGYGSEPAAGNGADPYYADEKAEKSEKGASGKTRDRVSGTTKADQ